MSDTDSIFEWFGDLGGLPNSADPDILNTDIQDLDARSSKMQTDRLKSETVFCGPNDYGSSFSERSAWLKNPKEAAVVDMERPLLSTSDLNPFVVKFGQVAELPEFQGYKKGDGMFSVSNPLSFSLFRYLASIPKARPTNSSTSVTTTTSGAVGFGNPPFLGKDYTTATEKALPHISDSPLAAVLKQPGFAGRGRLPLYPNNNASDCSRSSEPPSIDLASTNELSQSQRTCFDPPPDPPLPLLKQVPPLPPELAAEVIRVVSASPPADPSTFPRNKLHPCADTGASLWRDEADLYGTKPRWGCTRCAKHFSRPKTLQQHVRDKHKDLKWDYFSTCINNPHVSGLDSVIALRPGSSCFHGFGQR